MRSDQNLQQLVLKTLDFDPEIDCSTVGIIVRDGIVTLTGHVSSNAAKRAAEIAAGRVEGVKAVIDDLLVELPDRSQTEDESIAERCYEYLAADETVPLDRIHISVTDGTVTIHGDVDFARQRDAVEAAVKGMSFVRGVVNELTIRPPVRAEIVRERVRQVLRPISAINAEKIEVRADGTHVTLRGAVNSWHERGLAEDAVWSVPGVTSLDDQIVVL